MVERKSPAAGADFVAKIVKDPKQPPDTLVLTGYLGASSEEGHTRLYFDPSLSNYVEIPDDAILHTQDIAADQGGLGGTYVWIKRDAELIYGPAGSQRPRGKFLEGPIMQAHLQGAAAGAGVGAILPTDFPPCRTPFWACPPPVTPNWPCTEACWPSMAHHNCPPTPHVLCTMLVINCPAPPPAGAAAAQPAAAAQVAANTLVGCPTHAPLLCPHTLGLGCPTHAPFFCLPTHQFHCPPTPHVPCQSWICPPTSHCPPTPHVPCPTWICPPTPHCPTIGGCPPPQQSVACLQAPAAGAAPAAVAPQAAANTLVGCPTHAPFFCLQTVGICHTHLPWICHPSVVGPCVSQWPMTCPMTPVGPCLPAAQPALATPPPHCVTAPVC
jgi:hypothetical protein